MAAAYDVSNFNPFTPGAPLAPFETLLVRAEAYRSPAGHHLQVRQYGGNFDEGENLVSMDLPIEGGGRSRAIDLDECATLLGHAGWRVTGQWTRSDRGSIEAPVEPI